MLFWFGGTWEMSTFDQARMMERFCELLGGEKEVGEISLKAMEVRTIEI